MDELSPEQCYELLHSEQVGHLGVISDGDPYVTPLSYVLSGRDIGMRVGPGRRVTAIEENPRACFEVSSYNPETGAWKSVIVHGRIRTVDDATRIQAAIGGLLTKYRDVVSTLTGSAMPMPNDVVLVLEIEEISGRSSGSYFTRRTRPGRL